VKDLSALRSNLEGCPGSRGDLCHAAWEGELEEGSLRLSYLWDKVVGL